MEICSEKSRCLSKMKPRLRAETDGRIGVPEVTESDGLDTLASCWGRPMRRNSVFAGFNVRRLADIQFETSCRTDSRWLVACWKAEGLKERKSGVSPA